MSACPADLPPGEDPLLAGIEAVQRAAEAAARALVEVSRRLEESRRQRAMGMPLPMIADAYVQAERIETRHRAAAAMQEYERAYMLLRAELVRSLVEDHGYTLTEVAKTMQISRQLVSRLLDAGRSGTFDPAG